MIIAGLELLPLDMSFQQYVLRNCVQAVQTDVILYFITLIFSSIKTF